MPEEKDANHILKGAAVLTVAAFIVKILSAVYRVPFQNIVGDAGFYIYQQVYPLYGIAAGLSLSGFPVILSRLIAERENGKRLSTLLQTAFFSLVFLSSALFLLFFAGADAVAGLMGDGKLAPVIRVTSIIFLFMPFLSVLRGYFQGAGNMVPTAASQAIDQTVRVTAIIGSSFFLVNAGYSLYETSAGAMAGAAAGAAAGLLVLLLAVRKRKRDFQFGGLQLDWRLGKVIIVQGAAIAISSMVLVLLQLLDSFTLYPLLINAGAGAHEAKVWKGVYDRGQPLLQLGTVAATAISLSIVPAIARKWQADAKEKESARKKASTALKLTLIIGTGAAFGLANLIRPVNEMLFETTDGSSVLGVLSLAILFCSVILTMSGMMQGIGMIRLPALYILFGAAVKWLGNCTLVPALGTMGAAVSTVASLLFILSLFIRKVNGLLPVLPVLRSFTKPAVPAVLAMTAVLQAFLLVAERFGSSGRGWAAVLAMAGVLLGGSVYLAVIWKSSLLSEEERNLLPFVKR